MNRIPSPLRTFSLLISAGVLVAVVVTLAFAPRPLGYPFAVAYAGMAILSLLYALVSYADTSELGVLDRRVARTRFIPWSEVSQFRLGALKQFGGSSPVVVATTLSGQDIPLRSMVGTPNGFPEIFVQRTTLQGIVDTLETERLRHV